MLKSEGLQSKTERETGPAPAVLSFSPFKKAARSRTISPGWKEKRKSPTFTGFFVAFERVSHAYTLPITGGIRGLSLRMGINSRSSRS